MRGFWQGIIIGGVMGAVIGMMSVPHLRERVRVPLERSSNEIGSLASKAFQEVRENMGEMWQRRVKE
ncbi:MAG: hypothetical protein ACOX3A_01605 [bacterium]|jgi:gas vesicle protein